MSLQFDEFFEEKFQIRAILRFSHKIGNIVSKLDLVYKNQAEIVGGWIFTLLYILDTCF